MTEHTLVVELYYGAAWHDLTAASEVYRNIIATTTRYGAGITNRTDPGSTVLSLVNTAGKYNPINPMSPLYGSIARCTPMRISVDGTVRWTGEAVEWKPRRVLGDVRRITLTGGGILRRLGIGIAPITSALTVAIMAASPLLYIPLTDGPWATVAGTPIALGQGADANGVTFGSIDGPPGDTRKLPEMARDGLGGLAVWTTTLATATTAAGWAIDLVARGVRRGDGFNTFNMLQWVTASGTPSEVAWQLTITWDTSDLTDTLRLYAYEVHGAGSLIVDQTALILMDGTWHHYRVQVTNVAGTTNGWTTVDDTTTAYAAATLPAGGVGTISLVGNANTVITSTSIGHIAIYDDAAPANTYLGFAGHPGEYAADRFSRICTENGIPVTIIGTPAVDSHPMGPQLTGRLRDVLLECATTDGGLMYESTTDAGLVLRCLGAMERQTAVSISVTNDLVPPLDQNVDDRSVRNDVTARRVGGSSARVTLASGPMSTQDPPTGVGPYATQVDVNPQLDTMLRDYAAWLVTLGTWEGADYPTITIDLDASAVDVTSIEIGTVVELTDLPPYDDPSTPRLLIMGMQESCDTHRRTLTLLTEPAAPYDVGILDTSGRLDCGGTTTAEILDTTETGIDIDIVDTCAWTHADGDFDILIGGERMTVTAVSAIAGVYPARTQTLTVTRSVNGVIKSHAVAAEVHVADPLILAL